MGKTNQFPRKDKLSAELLKLDEIIRDIWQDALRFALGLDGAAERCSRRACRAHGECRSERIEGKPLSCDGLSCDDLSEEEVVATALGLALFAGMMVMRVLYSCRSSPSAPWLLEDEA